jgi:histidinol-phosphate aminotransferase/imidazoleglycerol-phosphate dehydratase/histidinol-phosphatase
MSARTLPAGFSPYVWASTVEDVAARRGLRPQEVIRFDANVPPLPGVPRIPVGESFARLNEYPEGTYRELREAAAAYCGVSTDRIVVGAGADDLIHLVARTYLGPGRTAAVSPPTYSLYAIATALEGAEATTDAEGADVVWVCNPANPTGALTSPAEIAELARSLPDSVVAVDEAYVEYAGGDASVVPLIAETPNLLAIRTLSKAFGLAALRVGWIVAAPEVAAELTARRAPAPISAPSARIGAAALRDPRTDVAQTVPERERMRAALLAAGWACPPSAGNFVYLPADEPAALADRLEEQGLVVRRVAGGIRVTVRQPAENDRLLAALGAPAARSQGRSALVVRTTAETALRVSLLLDGQGRSRVDTGIGFLDHLLTHVAFHGGLDLELLAGGDLHVDEHHTVEDVLAALGDALSQALGDRAGVTRYGAATVPMDEARATAAVDLVRRPHAEIALAFGGDHVGALPVSLLSHALERFAMQAGITVHVESSGADDHHVAEAAFKALGRALREAVARGGDAVRSTKGQL